MYMRFVHRRMKSERPEELQAIYDTKILPVLRKVPGCVFASVIRNENVKKRDEYISMTLWSSREAVDVYRQSGQFQVFADLLLPWMAESSEWAIQLNQDQTLEYKPVIETARESMLTTVAGLEREPTKEALAAMHVRLVSLKANPTKKQEFIDVYNKEVLPELYLQKGCRFAFLTSNVNEANTFLSCTIWDSLHDAEAYEKTGVSQQLLLKLKHTLSELVQWKMDLGSSQKIATGDDMTVENYEIITGHTL